MKPALWFWTSLALACSGCAKDLEVVEVKVMTMNLRHNVDFWEERFPLIADEIVRLRPDLIGFQEVEIADEQSRVLLELIAAREPKLLYDYHEQLKTQLAAVSGEGIAIFSRFPIASRTMVDLSFGRPAIFDRVRVNDHLTIDMFNTHLHNEGGDEVRKPQMEALLQFIRTNDQGNITLLTGDMNSKPSSETYRTAVEAGFIDTFAEVFGAATEDVGNTSPIVLSKEPVEQHTTQRIDYVFLEQPRAGVDYFVRSSSVAFDQPNAEGLFPSDHLGVMTTLEINLNTLD